MLGRVLVNMIIIPAVILTLSNGIVNKSFANEEKNKTEYVISQSEESKFLEDIYKTETDTLKIKSVDKNRAQYYSFYTGKKWGDKLNYDICINTGDSDLKVIVEDLALMIEKK